MLGYKDAQHIYVHLEYFRCKWQKAQPKHPQVPRRWEITGHLRGCPQPRGLCPRENGQVLCQEDQLTFGSRRSPPMDARPWGWWEWLQSMSPQYPSQFRSHKIKKSYSSFQFLCLHIQRAISSEKNLWVPRPSSRQVSGLPFWDLQPLCISFPWWDCIPLGYSCPFSCAIRLWAPGGWPSARHGT